MENPHQMTVLHAVRNVLANAAGETRTVRQMTEELKNPQPGVTFGTNQLEVHRACRELERRDIAVMTTKSHEIADLGDEGWRIADPLAARSAVLEDAKPRKATRRKPTRRGTRSRGRGRKGR